MKDVVVLIPVHSATPKPLELIALERCFKILSHFDAVVIHPEGLDLREYHQRVKGFTTIAIAKKWFRSHISYNELKRSLFFYDLFKNYNYLLTYELDCFVFRDELKYWCSKGYDFIGAPWFDNYTGAQQKIVGVGNSGFSLRNVQTCRRILKSNKLQKSMAAIIKQHFTNSRAFLSKLNLVSLLRRIKEHSSLHLYKTFVGHEDAFWCLEVPKFFPDFNIAPVEEAYQFSIEEQPEYLIQLNNGSLPFGCHAWYRFDYWKPVIRELGYDV